MAMINRNIPVGPDYYLMDIIAPKIVLSSEPGQFVHVKVSSNNSYDPLLRRPLSIHDIDIKKGLLSLLYRVTGKGTEIMSRMAEYTDVDLIGPLGNGFKTDFDNNNILIIGGGMGLAPLYYLAKFLACNNNISLLMGGSSEEEVDYFYNQFKQLQLDIDIATMDGSRGYAGNVVQLWRDSADLESKDIGDISNSKNDHRQPYDYIYSCGPDIMLKKVQKLAQEFSIPGQLSLEKRMGCGIGVCLSCVCKTVNGNQRVCKEGPVFSLSEVIFDD